MPVSAAEKIADWPKLSQLRLVAALMDADS
jgi:hypothetical protein